jgi:large subunit ribosomal protein L9
MKIILLDKIQKLGEIGDVVEVSSGYARNFLIPKKKAMFASEENLKYVESKKSELAAASADEIANAQGKADTVSGAKVEIKVQVTEEGALYGSVGTREISEAFSAIDHAIERVCTVQLVRERSQKHLARLIMQLIKVLFSYPMEVSCVVEVSVQAE